MNIISISLGLSTDSRKNQKLYFLYKNNLNTVIKIKYRILIKIKIKNLALFNKSIDNIFKQKSYKYLSVVGFSSFIQFYIFQKSIADCPFSFFHNIFLLLHQRIV